MFYKGRVKKASPIINILLIFHLCHRFFKIYLLLLISLIKMENIYLMYILHVFNFTYKLSRLCTMVLFQNTYYHLSIFVFPI